jgi:hypothetical protein
MEKSKQSIGILTNKLKRYKLIMDLYNKHKTDDIPDSVVLRKYIYPIYPISRQTLFTIQCTPINKQIAELEQQQKQPPTD